MSLPDLIRREAAAQVGRLGVARHALVSAVDPANHACKVEIQPEGWKAAGSQIQDLPLALFGSQAPAKSARRSW